MTSTNPARAAEDRFGALLSAALRDRYQVESPSEGVRAALLRQAALGRARPAGSQALDRSLPAGEEEAANRSERRRRVELMHIQLVKLRFVL